MTADTDPTAATSASEVPICERDQEDVRAIYEKIRNQKAKLVGPDGEAKSLPSSVYAFLCRLLAELSDGKSISILQQTAELTTVQASHLLGVSRQFLINLLSRGEIPYHMVGTHRRMYARDVLVYKTKRDNARKQALQELIEAEMTEGIFDRMPEHDQLR